MATWRGPADGWYAGQALTPDERLTLPDALEPGFHGVRTPWIQGFMTFQVAGAAAHYLAARMTCRTTRQRVAWHDTNLGPFVVLNRLCLRG